MFAKKIETTIIPLNIDRCQGGQSRGILGEVSPRHEYLTFLGRRFHLRKYCM